MTFRLWTISLALVVATGPLSPPPPDVMAADNLAQRFATPSEDDKPWVYWWWLNGNVSEASIRSDLMAMKTQGIGGLLLFDARGYHDGHVPPPPVRMEFMGPEWRKMLKVALSEANRLGLKMSVNLSSCAGALKGPWDVGDDAPKQLVWATEEFSGPRDVKTALPGKSWKRSWNVAVLACRYASSGGQAADENPLVTEVVDLSDKLDASGQLAWHVPEGRWALVQLAATIMEGRQAEVDILSAEAITNYFQRMGKAILDDAGPLAGKTLTHFYSVSWEGASPTWTLRFEDEFQERRGYSMRQYLPVLAGLTVTSPEVSRRFLADYRRTIGDCFRDNCYGTLRDLSHRFGLGWHSESGGPWDRNSALFAQSDQLAFSARNDVPQGEFWWPSAAQTNARRTAMAAHIYGKPLAAVEAFTHMVKHWSAWPAALKPRADAAFCDGANWFIWHTFTASPAEFGKPGAEYFAGTHLNPNVTWWPQAGGLLTYLARCQHLLRQGRFVADVCCYTSDRNYAGWTRGQKWGEKPSLALPRGYTYDLINTETLLERMSLKDGRLALPDGMSYRLLVLDLAEDDVPQAALRKLLELAHGGATIVLGRRQPSREPGLKDFPACDAEVRTLAAQLWGEASAETAHKPGQGRVLCGQSLDRVLAAEAIPPDFAGPWDYIHRSTSDADIYFLAGQQDAECTFRVRGKEPELWDPITGEIRDAILWHSTQDGRIVVPIHLPQDGSIFVIFRRPAREDHLVSISGLPGGLELIGRTDSGARVRLWRKGVYSLETASQDKRVLGAIALADPRTLDGPWQVRFETGRGVPPSASFERLIPWNEHPDPAIRYFSGTASYRLRFDLDETKAAAPLRLALGRIGHVAQVRVNGTPAGLVWTEPWTVDLTGKVKAGANELQIDVTNTWQNRLIGDAALPPSERHTRTNIRLEPRGKLKAFEGYTAQDPLAPSGLIGPVRLEFGAERQFGL